MTQRWYKYHLDSSVEGTIEHMLDRSFEKVGRDMGGYDPDSAYANKDTFFSRYFWNYHLGRLEVYDRFLRKRLKKTDEILSLGSGRCANELFLMEDGYHIVCSDIKKLPAHEHTRSLFPTFDFKEYNILENPFPHQFNAIICLSVIYLFNDAELELFFKNVHASLRRSGILPLDSAGSPDNTLSYIIHDIVLKYEEILRRLARLALKQRWDGLIREHFGYRRSDEDIIRIGQQSGLRCTEIQRDGFMNDFLRSSILTQLIKWVPGFKLLLKTLGRNIPYIRMFKFDKD